MITLRRKLFLLTAITMFCAAVQPAVLSAQTTGVGSDGYTRVLWRATDSSVSLWKLDSSLNYSTGKVYGPINGWVPVALVTGLDNYTRLLWRATDGSAALWLLDSNLNLVTSANYGAYFGWTPESLSIDSADRTRLIWKETDGAISVWMLGPTLAGITSHVYGPYFGYDPGPAAAQKPGAAAPTTSDIPQSMQRVPSIPIPPPE